MDRLFGGLAAHVCSQLQQPETAFEVHAFTHTYIHTYIHLQVSDDNVSVTVVFLDGEQRFGGRCVDVGVCP